MSCTTALQLSRCGRFEVATGTVKWFDHRKGFGFIRPDIGPADVFVHVSAVQAAGFEALGDGQRLEFELTQMSDGRLTALGLRSLPVADDEERA
jgi:CspA family cold shock protein